jgi:hypothetical protein
MYPYLGLSSFLFLFSLVLILSLPRHRKILIFSGLFSLPFSLFSIAFVPEYWNPEKIGGWIVGIEDLLFSFATGCIAWGIYCLISKKECRFNFSFFSILKRYMIVTNLCILAGIFLWLADIPIMTATIIIILIVGVILFYYHKNLWFSILLGAIGFTIFYAIIISLFYKFWPLIFFQWSTGCLSGMVILGIPIEEIIWAFVFGAVWPMFIIFIGDIKVNR